MAKKKKETEVVKDNWSLSIGTYPGILFGSRAYEETLHGHFYFVSASKILKELTRD